MYNFVYKIKKVILVILFDRAYTCEKAVKKIYSDGSTHELKSCEIMLSCTNVYSSSATQMR